MSDLRTDLPFAIVPVWLMEAGLSNSALRVYISLARRADNETGQTWPGRATIAKESSLSLKSVDRGITELCDLGALTKHHRLNDKGEHTSNLYIVHRVPKGGVTDGGSDTGDARWRQNDYTELDPKNYTYSSAEDEGAAAPVSRDTSEVIDTGRNESVQTAASKNTGKGSQRSITDTTYAARLLDELGDAAPDLDAERLADNYLALFGAARKAGKDADSVAIGLTLGLLVKTFGPLPAQARGMVVRLVKANGPTGVMQAAVTTVGSSIGSDPKFADDPMAPVKYLSGVVRGRK
jgi:hypothetical protein